MSETKTYFKQWLGGILFLSVLLATKLNAYGRQLHSAVKVVNLTCEYTKEPLGIDERKPRLSWQMISALNGESQTAYQVLVASSKEALNKDSGDIWDTGIVNSPQSIQLEYAGLKLRSRGKYYWKVRVWDNNHYVTAWSAISSWEMGLLEMADWSAKWISAPTLFDFHQEDAFRQKIPYNGAPQVNEPAPLLRKQLSITKPIKQARVYITGLGYYELYLNGARVGDHVLDPAFTNYSKTVLYTTYDVTDMLTTGNNVVGVALANGWYNMTSRALWAFDKARWRDYPTVRCQLEITYNDGTTGVFGSDKSWTCGPGPLIFNSIQQGETYDARLEQPGWTTTAFDQQTWVKTEEVRGPQGQVKAATIPPVKIMKTLEPVKITRIQDSVYVVDFGQNISGFEQVSLQARAGIRIRMKCGEKLDEQGLVDQDNIRFQIRNDRFQTDEYITSGKGTEVWHPNFNYNGFRYVEVRGFPGELRLENMKALVTYTSFNEAGSFSCSNPLINHIQQAVRWSYTNNFVGYPTDCPHREKNGWTGDAQLAAETGLFNFAAQTAYTKWIGDMSDAQHEDGMFPAIVPTAGWGYGWGNGPAWDHAYAAIPWWLYVYSNDKHILATIYPGLKKYIALLQGKAKNNIVDWGLGDWAPAETKTPEDITSTGYYYADVRIACKIATILGDDKAALAYDVLARQINDAFNQTFYHKATGTYANGSETAQACALYMNLAGPSEKEKVLNKLTATIAASPLNLDFGILGSKFVPNSLADNGRPDIAYKMINSTRYPGWGNMVSRGGTTLWSTWIGKSSLNHVMFGDVSAWFYKHLAGIQPDEDHPGFSHFYFKPYFPADVKWIKASYQTGYGPIGVDWKKDAGRLSYEVSIPVNTTASVYLPVKNWSRLKINGKYLSSQTELHRDQEGEIYIELPSGVYQLSFEVINERTI